MTYCISRYSNKLYLYQCLITYSRIRKPWLGSWYLRPRRRSIHRVLGHLRSHHRGLPQRFQVHRQAPCKRLGWCEHSWWSGPGSKIIFHRSSLWNSHQFNIILSSIGQVHHFHQSALRSFFGRIPVQPFVDWTTIQGDGRQSFLYTHRTRRRIKRSVLPLDRHV